MWLACWADGRQTTEWRRSHEGVRTGSSQRSNRGDRCRPHAVRWRLPCLCPTRAARAAAAAQLHGWRPGNGVRHRWYGTHPDVNNFFTSLRGLPNEEIRGRVQTYMDANPQVQNEINGIRQPLADLRSRCDLAEAPLGR